MAWHLELHSWTNTNRNPRLLKALPFQTLSSHKSLSAHHNIKVCLLGLRMHCVYALHKCIRGKTTPIVKKTVYGVFVVFAIEHLVDIIVPGRIRNWLKIFFIGIAFTSKLLHKWLTSNIITFFIFNWFKLITGTCVLLWMFLIYDLLFIYFFVKYAICELNWIVDSMYEINF